MKIEILGTGCPSCKELEEKVRRVVVSTGIEAVIEKITDMPSILGYGVMSLPALVVDGVVRISGRIPSEEELTELFKNA